MDDNSKESEDTLPSRRRLLQLGGLTAAAVVTVRPGIAQAAASIQNCSIPVPDAARSSNWIRWDGVLVAPNTPYSYPGATNPLPAEEIKAAMTYGTPYPGYGNFQSRAYSAYIRSLQQGTTGFTCYASIQARR